MAFKGLSDTFWVVFESCLVMMDYNVGLTQHATFLEVSTLLCMPCQRACPHESFHDIGKIDGAN